MIQHRLYHVHANRNERHIVSYPSKFQNFPDFDLRIKAKNAFSINPTISPVGHCKYTFFVQYDALLVSIISSNIRFSVVFQAEKGEKIKKENHFYPPSHIIMH